jgi:hypothetical protein
MSALETGEAEGIAGIGGISTDAVLPEAFGAELLNDCRPIGVGEVIEGVTWAGAAGFSSLSAGGCAEGAGSLEFSAAGTGETLPPSSSVIAILKVPSTMMTTLAPTSSERILEVTVDGCCNVSIEVTFDISFDISLVLSRAGSLSEPRAALSLTGAAAAAWAARRAAAMKFDVLACSRVPAEISLIALSEAAMRSDGEAARPEGRVPGSSG